MQTIPALENLSDAEMLEQFAPGDAICTANG